MRKRSDQNLSGFIITSLNISGLTDNWISIVTSLLPVYPNLQNLTPQTASEKATNHNKRTNKKTKQIEETKTVENAQNFLEGCVAVTDELIRLWYTAITFIKAFLSTEKNNMNKTTQTSVRSVQIQNQTHIRRTEKGVEKLREEGERRWWNERSKTQRTIYRQENPKWLKAEIEATVSMAARFKTLDKLGKY